MDWDRVFASFEGLSRLEPPSLRASAVKQQVMNGPIVESAMRGYINPEELKCGLCQALDVDMSQDHFVEVWNQLLSPNRAIEQIIERLKPEYRLVLASNTEETHFQHTIAVCPALQDFSQSFLSHEMGLLKPAPEFFKEVLKGLSTEPAQCVFIDDVQENVDAAEGLGIKGLLFQHTQQLKSDLEELLPLSG